jgi:hypothetical protein
MIEAKDYWSNKEFYKKLCVYIVWERLGFEYLYAGKNMCYYKGKIHGKKAVFHVEDQEINLKIKGFGWVALIQIPEILGEVLGYVR